MDKAMGMRRRVDMGVRQDNDVDLGAGVRSVCAVKHVSRCVLPGH